MRIKVMTYNIQHGRNHNLNGDIIDFENIAVPILKEAPDIVGLNEVRSGGADKYDDQSALLAEICGGEPIFGKACSFGNNKDYGNAVISKLPVLSSEVVTIPDPVERKYKNWYETRCVLCVTVKCGSKPLKILSTHFGLNPDERENAVNTVLQIAENDDNPIILMGDFNLTPESETLRPLSKVLENAAVTLDNSDFTFSSDDPVRTIDYIWYRGVAPIKMYAVKEIHSDHFPLVAYFEIP